LQKYIADYKEYQLQVDGIKVSKGLSPKQQLEQQYNAAKGVTLKLEEITVEELPQELSTLSMSLRC
jgi:hypothetical protein